MGTLDALAETVVARYADVLPDPRERRAEVRRYAEQASWTGQARSVLDIGGGYSPFDLLLAELGVETTVLDNFDHPYFEQRPDHHSLLERAGVRFVRQDAVGGDALPFPDASFEAITTFDSLEHWHHSPKRLFGELRRVLAPGGRVVIGVPNAVNLRKRLTVPLGRSNWSRFEDWYEPDIFLGHVREPTVEDLGRIAEHIGLAPWKIIGRNWLGYRKGWLSLVTQIVDRPLRLRPSLCSTLYLVGDLR